jgi:hypothetical protein
MFLFGAGRQPPRYGACKTDLFNSNRGTHWESNTSLCSDLDGQQNPIGYRFANDVA